jgi:hypothetical protein
MGIGKMLILIGVIVVVMGIATALAERFGWPRLPGDVTLRSGKTTFYFPIATSIVLSVVLTLVLNLLIRKR